ncbi:hypothetical protein SAMN05660479_03022 [Microbulbifer thermotolerans]|nr:hypothetical protein SAMN05660479_03022 [Microbulbifer thermotolerans]
MYPSELQGSTRAFSKCPSYCLSAPEATIVSTRINQRFLKLLKNTISLFIKRYIDNRCKNTIMVKGINPGKSRMFRISLLLQMPVL